MVFFLVRTNLLVSLRLWPAQTLGWARWCRTRWQLAHGICTRGQPAGPARWTRCCGRWWGLSICYPRSSRSPRCRTARHCHHRRRSRTTRGWGRSCGCLMHKECRQVGLAYLQKRMQSTPWGSDRTSIRVFLALANSPSLSIPLLCFTAITAETVETKTSPSYACNLPW